MFSEEIPPGTRLTVLRTVGGLYVVGEIAGGEVVGKATSFRPSTIPTRVDDLPYSVIDARGRYREGAMAQDIEPGERIEYYLGIHDRIMSSVILTIYRGVTISTLDEGAGLILGFSERRAYEICDGGWYVRLFSAGLTGAITSGLPDLPSSAVLLDVAEVCGADPMRV